MAEQSLKDKTVKGVGWSAVDSLLGQGITFIVGLVLARILSPSEYGLIGIVTIFITVFNAIIDSGFSQAVIRKKDADSNDYNTMFITNMVLSVCLFGVLFLCAPAIARFFERPELISLSRVMGVVMIINALAITQNTVLTKRVDFKTKTKASLISAVLSGFVGIGMAFMGYGVWALVGQQIIKQLTNTICLWLFNKWWPNFKFSRQSFNYMWGFGWKLLVSGLLDNIWNQLYQVVVGKYYSPTTLGQYSRAHGYSNLLSMNITSIVSRVTFPVLSEIQDDKTRLMCAYRRIIKVTMFVSVVCLISLGAIAEPLIYCMIGPQWQQAATFLPLICISMSLYPLHAINLNMLKVQGRSDLFLKLEIIKKVIAIGPICLGIFVNIYWMLIGSIIVGVICFFLNSYYTGKKLGYSSWRQLCDITPSYVLASVVALSVYFLKYLPWSHFIILPLQIAVGVIVLFSICETTRIQEYMELKSIGMSIIYKYKNNN